MYIEKTHDDYISFTHKLIPAAAHYTDNFKRGFLGPGNLLGTPCSTRINTITLLPVCQMFMSSM